MTENIMKLKVAGRVFEIETDFDSMCIMESPKNEGWDLETSPEAIISKPIILSVDAQVKGEKVGNWTIIYGAHSATRFDNGTTIDYGLQRHPFLILTENGPGGPHDLDVWPIES